MRYTTIKPEEVHTFDKPWKEPKYWHKYTEDQIEAVKWLIGKLAMSFPTLGVDNDLSGIFEFNPEVVKDHLPGIWTHNSVRADKSDIFPYPPMIKALEEVQSELINVSKPHKTPEKEVKKAGKSGSK